MAVLLCGLGCVDSAGSASGTEEADLSALAEEVTEALLAGKADSASFPTIVGGIAPGTVRADLSADRRFPAWTFAATGRPTVDVAATLNADPSALFLFWRPTCARPWGPPVVYNLATIRKQLPGDGEYMLVATSKRRGDTGSIAVRFAVDTSSASGNVVPLSAPPVVPGARTRTLARVGAMTVSPAALVAERSAQQSAAQKLSDPRPILARLRSLVPSMVAIVHLEQDEGRLAPLVSSQRLVIDSVLVGDATRRSARLVQWAPYDRPSEGFLRLARGVSYILFTSEATLDGVTGVTPVMRFPTAGWLVQSAPRSTAYRIPGGPSATVEQVKAAFGRGGPL